MPKIISMVSRIRVVSKLNPSLRVAALKARLNSFGLPAIVRAMNELVTQVPIFEPMIIGMANFTSDIIPAPTIETAIEVVAVAFCMIAVAIIPIESAANGLKSRNRMILPIPRAIYVTMVKPIVMKLNERRKRYRNRMNRIALKTIIKRLII